MLSKLHSICMINIVINKQLTFEGGKLMEKMLVTQALDERDLLRKKIINKIEKASFVDTIKKNEDNVKNARITNDEFKKDVEASYQQIESFIERFRKIEAAIVLSNATNTIETSYGKYTIAEAITIKRRLQESASYYDYDEDDYDGDFENVLCEKLKKEFDNANIEAEKKNMDLKNVAENMRLSILGKDNKTKEDKPLEVVDVYVKENTTEIVDPLNVKKIIEKITERKDTLLRELDTKIKVSNATTFIEI